MQRLHHNLVRTAMTIPPEADRRSDQHPLGENTEEVQPRSVSTDHKGRTEVPSIEPSKTRIGHGMRLPAVRVGDNMRPPSVRVGDNMRLPAVRLGDNMRLPAVRVGDNMRLPAVRVGDNMRVHG
jgi:hypothetical protein